MEANSKPEGASPERTKDPGRSSTRATLPPKPNPKLIQFHLAKSVTFPSSRTLEAKPKETEFHRIPRLQDLRPGAELRNCFDQVTNQAWPSHEDQAITPWRFCCGGLFVAILHLEH